MHRDRGEERAQLAGVERATARERAAAHVLDVGRALVRLDVHEPEPPGPAEHAAQRAEVAIRGRRRKTRGQGLAHVDHVLRPEPVPGQRATVDGAEEPSDGVEGFALGPPRAGGEAGEVSGCGVAVGRQRGLDVERRWWGGRDGERGGGHRHPG